MFSLLERLSCRGGGTGRRGGLKIRFRFVRIVGSNPTPGTILYLIPGRVPGMGLIARGGYRQRSLVAGDESTANGTLVPADHTSRRER